jgi:hypothetical protein
MLLALHALKFLALLVTLFLLSLHLNLLGFGVHGIPSIRCDSNNYQSNNNSSGDHADCWQPFAVMWCPCTHSHCAPLALHRAFAVPGNLTTGIEYSSAESIAAYVITCAFAAIITLFTILQCGSAAAAFHTNIAEGTWVPVIAGSLCGRMETPIALTIINCAWIPVITIYFVFATSINTSIDGAFILIITVLENVDASRGGIASIFRASIFVVAISGWKFATPLRVTLINGAFILVGTFNWSKGTTRLGITRVLGAKIEIIALHWLEHALTILCIARIYCASIFVIA